MISSLLLETRNAWRILEALATALGRIWRVAAQLVESMVPMVY